MVRRIKFTNKRTSKKSLISLSFSAFTLIWLIVSLNLTSKMGDATPRVVGGISMLCFLLEISAVILAGRALSDEDVFMQLPVAAMITSLLFTATLVALIIIGLVGLLG